MPCRLSMILIAMMIFVAHGMAQTAESPLGQSLSELRRVSKQIHRGGLPGSALMPLLLPRFQATKMIQAEFDNEPSDVRYRAALLSVLALTRDPAIIPWLENKCTGLDGMEFARDWVSAWVSWWRRTEEADLRWVEKPNEWFHFFNVLLTREESPSRRIQILELMAWFFHTDDAIAFFVELDRKADTPESEAIVVQEYLLLHRRPTSRLQTMLSAPSKSKARQSALVEWACRAPHEAFVPFLISVYDVAGLRDCDCGPNTALREITFASCASKREWEQWYQQNSSGRRSDWIALRLKDLDQMVARDPSQARDMLDTDARWMAAAREPALIPHLAEWAVHESIHEELAKIVVGMCHPVLWKDLSSVGRRLWESPDISGATREALHRLGFDGSDGDWGKHIAKMLILPPGA